MCIKNDFTWTIGPSGLPSRDSMIGIEIISLSLSTEGRCAGSLCQHVWHMFHKLDSTSEWSERSAELCGNLKAVIADIAAASNCIYWKGIFPVRNSC